MHEVRDSALATPCRGQFDRTPQVPLCQSTNFSPRRGEHLAAITLTKQNTCIADEPTSPLFFVIGGHFYPGNIRPCHAPSDSPELIRRTRSVDPLVTPLDAFHFKCAGEPGPNAAEDWHQGWGASVMVMVPRASSVNEHAGRDEQSVQLAG